MSWITFSRPQLTLNKTADKWEFYGYGDDREIFARKLNDAIEDSWNGGDNLDVLWSKAQAIMKAGAKEFGAMDSEPQWHLEELIERRLRPRLES